MKDSTDAILIKLNEALEADGDFPTRAKLVSELQSMASSLDTPVDKVVELLMSDPALATRIMHLTNSVYYGKTTPISTVSQAVIHLGLKGIYNLCANFVLLQRFSSMVGKHSAFADCFLLSLITANLSSHLDNHIKTASGERNGDEEGYLAGSLFTLGPLLLGYYFPKLFTEAAKRSERKRTSIFVGVEELLGVSAVGVSLGVVDSLSVPEIYKDIILGAYVHYSGGTESKNPNLSRASQAVAAATRIGELIIESKHPKELQEDIAVVCGEYGFAFESVLGYLQGLPKILQQQSALHQIDDMDFPATFLKMLQGNVNEVSNLERNEDALTPYLEQIECAIAENETLASIIATVMEALNFACDFDRVVYLESDLNCSHLLGRFSLGEEISDFDSLKRDIGPDSLYSEEVDVKAFHSGIVEQFGEPLLNDGWPFAAIPVGSKGRNIGVIYADRISQENTPLDPLQGLVLGVLSDLLERAVSKART